MKPHVVIGGGIGGLVAAWSLRQRFPDAPVVVLEQASTLGGLLAGTRYPDAGLYFDQGTHIFQETGDAEIDAFIRDAIPRESLVVLPGDWAGAVFRGRLQTNSHFPDLRPFLDLTNVRDGVRLSGGSESKIVRGQNLALTIGSRFGPEYAKLLQPILSAMFQINSSELATLALLLPGLTRVITLDAAEWENAVRVPSLRAILGYPEQRELPTEFRHGRRSFYSRHEGSAGIIQALANTLTRDGIEIRTNASAPPLVELEAENVFIATGVVGAARLLGIDFSDLTLAPPLLHRIVHVVLEQPVDSDLQYFHGLDAANAFYRVTNYRAFSGEADDRRFSIEVLERAEISDERLPDLLLGQLHALGFLPSTRRTFARVERLPKGFPRPTTDNLRGLARLHERVRERLPGHVQVGGAGAGDGLFFTNEILLHAHRAIQSAPVR